ncbi:MAG TPA: SRPBCC family protein [Myxococcaceae bacterium]|nr:SRPBCC family protein [Myxococcaceae bacterium]
MKKADGILIGASGVATGATLMYLLDPLGGRRRRHVARDRARHAAQGLVEAVDVTSRDLSSRTRGVVAELVARLTEERVEDHVLEERVRSKLGRVCSHPGAVVVHARGGRVELQGNVLAREHPLILATVRKVRGVRELDDDLRPHEDGSHIPDLQGGAPRPGQRFGPIEEHWSLITRFSVSAAGVGLVGLSFSQRGLRRVLLRSFGGMAVLRAFLDFRVDRSSERGTIEVQKSILVGAPVREVFSFWQAFENFPRFMGHVKDVHRVNGGLYHWKVEGPAGTAFEWDAEITQLVPDRILAWQSVGRTAVRNSGIVRFDQMPDGACRVTVRLSYHPPGGAFGHGLAKLLGADPKREMDDDLLRFKALIETGHVRGHGEQVFRDEIRTPGTFPK